MGVETVTIQAEELTSLVVARLAEAGVRREDAEIVADVLVYADLRDTQSHGVFRVEHYVNRVRSGGLNLAASFSVERVRSVAGILDAQGGFGHVAARVATEEAVRMAREHGIGLVGVRNSSHCGSLAYYVDIALRAGMMGIVAANTDAAVVPFGGKYRFFGTNPYAFGFPGRKDSVLLDMATSEVAFGKIYYARKENVAIPPGWALDRNGEPTTDADEAYALFPFGGYKGFGINLMVEALTGVLAGGVFGPEVSRMYENLDTYRDLSSFHLVVDPTLFEGDGVYDTAQKMIEDLRAQPPASGHGEVLVPGDPERRSMERCRREGIQLPRAVYDYLTG
ncbi:MAG: Ldh family oxidoreductase [Spirochaetaceae bacterium]|nr:MAG: Ldh family oxidoreductase [Spirochaetaceae bacterium]